MKKFYHHGFTVNLNQSGRFAQIIISNPEMPHLNGVLSCTVENDNACDWEKMAREFVEEVFIVKP